MENEELRADLLNHLAAHEARSQWRFEELGKQVAGVCDYLAEGPKETGMSEEKVVVHNHGGDREGGGLNAAVTMAALGNRNEKDISPLIMAALGNRNEGRRDDDGFGMNGMGGILGIAALGLIFGRGNGGLFGGNGDGGGGAETRLQSNADTLAILNAIKSNSDAVSGGFATTALALSQGFAGVKDSVQASTFLLTNQLNNTNQNVSDQGCKTREAVQNDGDKTRALLVARFQQQDATTIAEQNARIVALETRSHADKHHADNVLQITNTNTAVAAQAQQQQQQQEQRQRRDELDFLLARISGSFNQVLAARQGQDVINFGGTMTASGTQAAANTQVR